MSCEDFPACGHELGCCPDYDPDAAKDIVLGLYPKARFFR